MSQTFSKYCGPESLIFMFIKGPFRGFEVGLINNVQFCKQPKFFKLMIKI